MHLKGLLQINLPLLSGGVSSQGMLSTEERGQRTLLEGVVNCPLGLQGGHESVEEGDLKVLWQGPVLVQLEGHISEIDVLWTRPIIGDGALLPHIIIQKLVVVLSIVISVSLLSLRD